MDRLDFEHILCVNSEYWIDWWDLQSIYLTSLDSIHWFDSAKMVIIIRAGLAITENYWIICWPKAIYWCLYLLDLLENIWYFYIYLHHN
jgi:hypothetical protein